MGNHENGSKKPDASTRQVIIERHTVRPNPAVTPEQRTAAVRKATTGLRLGVRITKDMYRP